MYEFAMAHPFLTFLLVASAGSGVFAVVDKLISKRK